MFKAVRFCLSVCLSVCLSACLSAHVVILYDDLLLSMTSCRLSTVVKVSCKKENDTFAKYSLPPATELHEGNVFTHVSGRMTVFTGEGRTHPTGMHSCYIWFHFLFKITRSYAQVCSSLFEFTLIRPFWQKKSDGCHKKPNLSCVRIQQLSV